MVRATAASLNSTDRLCVLQASLPDTWRMHPVRFASVLSVLEHGGRLRWSLLPAATLWRTPPEPQEQRGCSRAVHKLQEALAALRQAGSGRGSVRFGTAIDLGTRRLPLSVSRFITCLTLPSPSAAPGGWIAHPVAAPESAVLVDPVALVLETAALPSRLGRSCVVCSCF